MRSMLCGFCLLVVAASSAPADVLYSYAAPASGTGLSALPAVTFNFTVPSLLTQPTTIVASDLNAPSFDYFGSDLSIMSVVIDPGLPSSAPIIAPGVPFVEIVGGVNNQVMLVEGFCFVTDPIFCQATPNTQLFDHFGVFTDGVSELTIAPVADPQTATPEPRFEAILGLAALLSALSAARWVRQIG